MNTTSSVHLGDSCTATLTFTQGAKTSTYTFAYAEATLEASREVATSLQPAMRIPVGPAEYHLDLRSTSVTITEDWTVDKEFLKKLATNYLINHKKGDATYQPWASEVLNLYNNAPQHILDEAKSYVADLIGRGTVEVKYDVTFTEPKPEDPDDDYDYDYYDIYDDYE